MLTKQQWAMVKALREGHVIKKDTNGIVKIDDQPIRRGNTVIERLLKGGYIVSDGEQLPIYYSLTKKGMTVPPYRSQPRTSAPAPVAGFYLGKDREERDANMKRLEAIAEQIGMRSASEMLREIAIGKLRVIRD